MTDLHELPLFPLNTVLFPGMVLPLHIFEPRYKLMISECIKGNSPFGVVLIRSGQETGGDAVPYDYGTSAYVTQIEALDGGQMNIRSVGYRRFRIHATQQDKPYLVGQVEYIPLKPSGDPEANSLTTKLAARLRTYLDALGKVVDIELSSRELPKNSVALAILAAIVMPLPVEEKQRLLAASDVLAMLRQEQRLLRREMLLLDYFREGPPLPDEPDMPFSVN